ncbi:PEP-CTERM sorting domain-containing protein [Chamaesiphon polymorphus]|uniref:PEP-CTERM sorting domain-containing protein n=1 Tax=Chamaesiphon polymorphus CCALA 037 TaxID=2107692 RepID=A0A2T1GF63_9CYAN|nr:PEP-CTERM sorting domain-containing protein [Chamaesiphon polymorphus]PSB56134.1 PEP-CTERM sorting domain-containing protein [Chamaesiphon polymorphus CCALA 037]
MAVLFNGATTYTQDFNSLTTSTGANTWTNDSTLPGWSLFRQPTPGTAITTYSAENGSSGTGSFYSYGTTGAPDRALGGLGSGGTYFGSPASGNVAGWIAFAATNNSGAAINSVNIGFDGEQWRNNLNPTPQTMVLEYGFGNTFGAVPTWTAPGGNFNWTSPVATTAAAVIDGNTTGLVANRGGTLNTLNWSNNSTLWVRWIENNDGSNDHGLVIDNFSLAAVPVPSPTAVPEPADFMGSIVAMLAAAIVIKRRIASKSRTL